MQAYELANLALEVKSLKFALNRTFAEAAEVPLLLLLLLLHADTLC